MPDSRIVSFARTLVRHSVDVKAGEKVLIEAFDEHGSAVTALVDEVYRVGGIPFVVLRKYSVQGALIAGANEDQLTLEAEHDEALLRSMDCYIGIDAPANNAELAHLDSRALGRFACFYEQPVNRALLNTRWVSAGYPTVALAQSAGMASAEFEDLFFRVATMDYDRLGSLSAPLAERIKAADSIHVLAPGTDLSLSVKGFTALVADGRKNMPDGEVASTPVRNSMTGVISFNIPSRHNGFVYSDIRLVFEKGRVVEASANDTERLNGDIDIDENARYVGEFSFGTNPYISRHITDTLFDEKMSGSLHMALGNCYNFPGRDNGNHSAIHWDLIQSHLPQYGGGEVWVDGELIRKDGHYIPADLQGLNPENF